MFFIRSAKTLVFSSAGFEPARSDYNSEKRVVAAFYIKCLCFTETIFYNHQPDADTFVCKAGIEPAELCQNTLDIAV